MKTCSVIITGINQWDEFTRPLLDDLLEWGKASEIILVDNASEPPYPEGEHYKVIRTERVCYSAAINLAARETSADWLLSMNNDVSCYAEFMPLLASLEPNAIYARQIITEKKHTWFGNWIVAIPRPVWESVGEFDERFLVCGFEDADYSMRAIALGYPTRHADLPFFHHWGRTRWDIPGYPATRLKNIAYFKSKHGWEPGGEMVVTND